MMLMLVGLLFLFVRIVGLIFLILILRRSIKIGPKSRKETYTGMVRTLVRDVRFFLVINLRVGD